MATIPDSNTFSIDGPAGRLEAILESPRDGTPAGGAVICHPHPQHGGTMQNKVAHTLARAFVNCGFRALRFNFRGVGLSDGQYDDARGEYDDALAAVDWLRDENGKSPLWLGGFSFGAAIAVRAAVACEADGLVTVAPAVSRFAGSLDRQPDCPWLIVQGDEDELVAVDETIEWVNRLDPGPELRVFDGAEHFFHGRIVELRQSVEEFVAKHALLGTDPD